MCIYMYVNMYTHLYVYIWIRTCLESDVVVNPQLYDYIRLVIIFYKPQFHYLYNEEKFLLKLWDTYLHYN